MKIVVFFDCAFEISWAALKSEVVVDLSNVTLKFGPRNSDLFHQGDDLRQEKRKNQCSN